MHACECMGVRMIRVCMHARTCVCMYMHRYACVYAYMDVYKRVYSGMYVNACMLRAKYRIKKFLCVRICVCYLYLLLTN
jgi:hypothetical protein